MSYVSHEELIELAARHGYHVEWNHNGWARLVRPGLGIRQGMSPLFAPPEQLRRALLPKGHPEAVVIRPGMRDAE